MKSKQDSEKSSLKKKILANDEDVDRWIELNEESLNYINESLDNIQKYVETQDESYFEKAELSFAKSKEKQSESEKLQYEVRK